MTVEVRSGVQSLRWALVTYGARGTIASSVKATHRLALSQCEWRMVRILAGGTTHCEIASRLGLREQTVKNRLSAIYGNLGVRNRLELAVLSQTVAAETTRDSCSE
jgi:DNA-binding NarL/FixJ family response regulator